MNQTPIKSTLNSFIRNALAADDNYSKIIQKLWQRPNLDSDKVNHEISILVGNLLDEASE